MGAFSVNMHVDLKQENLLRCHVRKKGLEVVVNLLRFHHVEGALRERKMAAAMIIAASNVMII